MCILSGFPESHEFGPGDGHPLRLQQQVSQILVAAATPQPGLDVSVHGLDQTHRNLRPAVVQDTVEVVQQHAGQLLEGLQPLPAKLVNPALEVSQHGPIHNGSAVAQLLTTVRNFCLLPR